MYVIYVMENTVNNKKYIGQTNNFQQRMNAHRSDANNPKSHSYNTPLSLAIRKYGWDKFNNYILEKITDGPSARQRTNEREIYWIEYYSSLSSFNGYNLTIGGQGCPREPLTYEEKLTKSKIFSPQEIQNIQEMLRNGEQSITIREKYAPRLKQSYLDNINSGLNFNNPAWQYPLRPRDTVTSNYYTTVEIKTIKNDIISGIAYKDIAAKWRLSLGMISGINNGRIWRDPQSHYPLSIRSHSKSQNAATWVPSVQDDLMHSDLSLIGIATKYNKAYSTIKKINNGSSHRNALYKYPLTSNRK